MNGAGNNSGVWMFRVIRATVVVFVVCWVVQGVAFGMPSVHEYEIVPGSFRVSTSLAAAGAHADLTIGFDVAHEEVNGVPVGTFNDNRTTMIELPAGFIGNVMAVPTCTVAQLIGSNGVGQRGNPECSPASQVGVIGFEVNIRESGYEQVRLPLYNMEVTSFGVTAQFGFNVAGTIVQVVDARVRPGDSGITVESPNIAQLGEARNVSVTTWGLPAARVHDPERGMECFSTYRPICEGGGKQANIPVKPFLANPTSCDFEIAPHIARIRADSWEEPEKWATAETVVTPASVECERVPFHPSIEVQPTTRSAESSSGLNISLVVPQSWENPVGLASSHLKDSVVALPVGYTANPSLAAGLGVCTPEQLEEETSSTSPGAGCPDESQIGTVEVETPVLDEKLTGFVYIAKPFDNPFSEPGHPNGSLLALYIVVKSPQRGIVVKVAGRIEPDKTTGQLVTRFEGNPQVPFSRFKLKLRQGANSPLVSPPACGAYEAEAILTPWSAPFSPQHMLGVEPLSIETGIGGGPCPAGGVPPLKPEIVSGTQNNAAGRYSPFYLRIGRQDGEQELTGFTTVLAPGLSANLKGIALCADTAIETARQASGEEEIDAPSCPPASEIGHTIAEAGVGKILAQTPGKVYLAGPYHGSGLSIVSITIAKVGPFDLGTVVVRFALRINPITAQAEVDSAGSDPIPHIIKGIVAHVRDIRVYMDRPNFVLNPTSCRPLRIANAVTGAGADPSNPADQQTVTVTSPFQAADCRALNFKPVFKASTSGKTSRANGASLTATLTYPKAPQGTQTNIRSVKVSLPKQLPSRLSTLQHGCLASVFEANPAACPSASRVGTAKAITPILPVPLEGPAYFVSHGGAKFPELIVVLQGYGITIELHGETFISKTGITSSTFRNVPDAPVSSFQLTLPQGPGSALAANGNLCALTRTVTQRKRTVTIVHGHRKTVTRTIHKTVPAGLSMPTTFTAQNGLEIHQSTQIAVLGCRHPKPGKKRP
jgi:hypothetical protein